MECYALKNLNCKNSSSGGAFPTIVQVLRSYSENLIVYGAAFDSNFMVKHFRCTDEKSCRKLSGSKYVQSNINNSLKKIENDLIYGHTVLFTGTPCQVATVKQYLKNKNIDMGNLYLVDILCHGTPSEKYWNDYRKWIEKKENAKLVKYSFRYPKAKWQEYPVMALFDNGKKYVNTFKLRQFICLYFSNYIMRDCCYKCKYANVDRVSDITIGDFWGIENLIPDFPYKNNVSEMLVSSSKGKSIIEKIKQINDKNIKLRKYNLQDFIKYQQPLNKPVKKPDNINDFITDYDKYGFEYVIRKYGRYNIKGFFIHIIKKSINILK